MSEIRKFSVCDLERVAQIWLNTNIKAHNFISPEYWQNNYEQVKQMFPTAEIYVFESDRIYGFIGLNDNFIEGIFTDEKMQSKGIGKALMDYVKRIKNNLELSVYQKNIRAIEFYKREGFIISGESIDTSTGEKEYYMFWEK